MKSKACGRVILKSTALAPLLGPATTRPRGRHWVGVAYSLSYLTEDEEDDEEEEGEEEETPLATPLEVQVCSANRGGRGKWQQGIGRLVVSGVGGASMRGDVLRAREWVIANQAAIRQALASESESESEQRAEEEREQEQDPERWPWEREDLHVHFAIGDWQGMCMGIYTSVVATAMVSFFTGRPARRNVAIMGWLFPADRWLACGQCVYKPSHGKALQRQGFDQLAVPEEDEAIDEKMLESLRGECGVQLLVAEGPPSSVSIHPEYAFVPMLKTLLLSGAGEEEEEEGEGGSDASMEA